MAKNLRDLGAGKGQVLPSPVVAPVTSPGQAVPASPSNVIDVSGVRMSLAESQTSEPRQVFWVRSADGRVVAHALGTLDALGTSSALDIAAFTLEASDTSSSLRAVNASDGGAGAVAALQIGGVYYVETYAFATGAAADFTKLLLDETGGSDFGVMLHRYPARATVTANADTTLLAGSGYSVPAKLLGPDAYGDYGALHVVMGGDYLNNTGATKTLTFKIAYGATTLWAATTLAFGASATRRTWNLEFWLGNENATNAQAMWGTIGFSNASAPTSGLGALTGTPDVPGARISGTAAEDSTAAQTLNVTVAHSVAGGATLDIRRYGSAYIERL